MQWWCWPVWVLRSGWGEGGEQYSSQESQTAAPDTEGSHVLMLKPSLVKDRVMNSETWGLAKCGCVLAQGRVSPKAGLWPG